MVSRSRSASDLTRSTAVAGLLAALLLVPAACGRLSGGGGGGGGGGSTLPAPDAPVAVDWPFLVSVLPERDAIHVVWSEAVGPPPALFVGTDEGTLFDGEPAVVDPPGRPWTLDGLAEGVEYYVGLAQPADGAAPLDGSLREWQPVGPVLSALTGPPIFVDVASTSPAPDGLTPETAFPLLLQGLLTALVAGGGNVWVAGGEYTGVADQVFEGTRVYGGFGPGFDPESRDPAVTPTVLVGASGNFTLGIVPGLSLTILDGLTIDGKQGASVGVEVAEALVEMRRVDVRDVSSAGYRLRGPDDDVTTEVRLIACQAVGSGGEGLSLDGAVDLRAEVSSFDGNVQEGVDMDDLVAPDGMSVRVWLRGCRFARNGAEGLDMDLRAPLIAPVAGGRFDVLVENCLFEENGSDGALIDIDYEAQPLWSAEVVLRGCTSRANRASGFLLDLDGPATSVLHRLLAVGNEGDGVLLRSETLPGVATVAATASVGNGGAGLRGALGNVSPLISHCVVAGNLAGGVVSDPAPASAVSTIASLQPLPWAGAVTTGVALHEDPVAPCFVLAPRFYGLALQVDEDVLTLADLGPLVGGELVELADDGVPRVARLVGVDRIAVDPAPGLVLEPALLTAFATGDSVDEDYRLAPGSPGIAAGMTPPGLPPVDAGLFSAPLGGPPGSEAVDAPSLFRIAAVSPPLSETLGSSMAVQVDFSGGVLDAGSVGPESVVARDATGERLSVVAFEQDGRLRVEPAGASWATDDLRLELHAGLRSLDGRPLATPSLLPFGVVP